jgi:hypothetical protein
MPHARGDFIKVLDINTQKELTRTTNKLEIVCDDVRGFERLAARIRWRPRIDGGGSVASCNEWHWE